MGDFSQDVLKKGSGGWRKVVAAFGNEILLDNGEVDRAKLGQIVFSDPGKRQLLNRYIHILSSFEFYEMMFTSECLEIKMINVYNSMQ